jgi:hypothetical protein
MTKKENLSKAGNNSLLQTARTKSFGAGKFASLSLKSNPQPPVKKVKAPISLPNNSGATDGKLKPNNNDAEVESSVLGMSMNSGSSFELSLSKAYIIQGTKTTNNIAGSEDYAGKKQNPAQSTAFSFLWPAPTVPVNAVHQQLHNHVKSKKFVKSPKYVKKEVTITKKKTMDISKGLRFSAPAPMTLNRYQPQMGQEKTAPESKEYLEMQAKKKKHEQRQIEAKHMAEAKIVIEERFKQAFELEEMNAGLDDQYIVDNENRNLVGNVKKSLMKKFLGKVRPKSSKKWQQNQDKSSAIQAAMAAAAAAVEAATGNPSGMDGGNGPISEEEARAIVSQALVFSRQKNKTKLSGVTLHPSMINFDRCQMAAQEIDEPGRSVQFPVNEVMMKRNEDSVSDLDASIRNTKKLPVVEIHMNNSKQCHGDDSVSTLGTPRIFEQLDKLLLSEPHRLQQRPGLIRDFLDDNMGGSAAPPPMVTSHDARALIDQLDSGTMGGDMTVATARAENAVQLCNIASNCFHPDQKYLLMEASFRNQRIKGNDSSHAEESFDDSESSVEEKASNDGTWSSPTQVFTQAIDNAIRKAEIQIATNHSLPLTPIGETGEMRSPIGSPFGSKAALRESKSPSASPRTIPTWSQTEIHPQPDQQTANFDSFMNIAASKLDKGTETGDRSRQQQHRRDRCSTEIGHSPEKNINHATPRTRGGIGEQFFGQKPSEPVEKAGRNLMHDLSKLDKHLRIDERNEKDASKKKKPFGKTLTGVGAPNDGFMMEQGKFLLEKDDAYWDTLSTIASTANDRSSESDEYMDEFIQPGPIPGEITTSSSEIKSVTTPAEAQNFNLIQGNGIRGEGALEKNQHLEQGFLSQSEENLNEMMNDVTDLIDSNLLDQLPISKNRRSINPISLKHEKNLGVIEIDKISSPSNRKIIRMMSNQMRPCPETVDRSKLEENRRGSLAIAASSIAKGIRSVSWGFEEIYEDKNSHLDLSDHDTNDSEGSNSMTRTSRPYPEGMQRNQRRSLDSADVQTGKEEDLLSRTLELSRGLLETIMGSQLIQENNNTEEGHDSHDIQCDKSDRNEHTTLTECRDDFHQQKIDLSATSENDLSPMINSRLESLRNQRTRALSKFRQSQMEMPASRSAESAKRDRDRLKYYSSSHDYGKPSSKEGNRSKSSNYQHTITKQSYSNDSDIELKYTTSDSNASSTPSQRARDLRIQLDEAMRASREIQISQNQLGNELNSFKKKYYKSPKIQNYETKAALGL